MDTLSVAHGRGVIHCDIKPHNIVCSPDDVNKPIIIDQGLATVTGNHTESDCSRGTPGYASVSSLRRNGENRRPERRSNLTTLPAPHVLDDFESLIYVVEYLLRGCLPWSHLTESEDCDALLKQQEAWVPENAPLQEFLLYTRDRR